MKLLLCLVVFAPVLFSRCTMYKPHFPSEVIAAMRDYDRLIQKVDADSIALLYTKDGELGTARGRDSIRNFLSSFKNVQVLLQASTTDSILLKGDSAVLQGRFKQVAVVSGKDTLRPSGKYNALWQWVPAEGWRIKRMNTTPDTQ